MISSLVQLVFVIFALVMGAALEELLPEALGVGVPVLMAAASFFAVRRIGIAALPFAVLAGAMEDALSSLPPMTSVSYFLAVAFLARFVASPGILMALVYPIYQIWLAVWFPGIGGGVFARVLLACPTGLVTAYAVDLALTWLSGKAAVHERG